MAEYDTKMLGSLLGVDPSDANALSAGVRRLLTSTMTATDLAAVLSPKNVIHLREDFLGIGATTADNPNVTINQSGTDTAAAVAAAVGGDKAGLGGWIAGATDDVDAECDEVALGQKPFCLVSAIPTVASCEIGFCIPGALTDRLYFFGWTDDETEGGGNGPINIDGTTNVVAVAANAAGFMFSSAATDADGFYVGNVKATTAIADAVNSGLTAVVDDYIRLRVDLNAEGDAFFYGAVDTDRDATLPLVGSLATAVATTSVLLPMFCAAPTTTTAVPWEIDYIEATVA